VIYVWTWFKKDGERNLFCVGSNEKYNLQISWFA